MQEDARRTGQGPGQERTVLGQAVGREEGPGGQVEHDLGGPGCWGMGGPWDYPEMKTEGMRNCFRRDTEASMGQV